MDFLIYLVVVLIIVALVMWLIYYIPFPPGSPVWIKNAFYVAILLVAILALAYRLTGGFGHAF